MNRAGKTFSYLWSLMYQLFNKRTVTLEESQCKHNCECCKEYTNTLALHRSLSLEKLPMHKKATFKSLSENLYTFTGYKEIKIHLMKVECTQ